MRCRQRRRKAEYDSQTVVAELGDVEALSGYIERKVVETPADLSQRDLCVERKQRDIWRCRSRARDWSDNRESSVRRLKCSTAYSEVRRVPAALQLVRSRLPLTNLPA